jgi:hypothetical protein
MLLDFENQRRDTPAPEVGPVPEIQKPKIHYYKFCYLNKMNTQVQPERSPSMTITHPLIRVLTAAATLLALFSGFGLQAQTKNPTPSQADYAAAGEATNVTRHVWRAITPAGQAMSASALSIPRTASNALAPVASAPDSGGPRYPADLNNNGGAVVVSMENHAIYLHPNGGCTIAGCWGNPERFLRDLGKSEMIHIVDQYTGSTANNRYTVAEEATNVNYTPPPNPFTDNDMLALVHAVVVSGSKGHHYESGYGNEYHVFLPPGQDECIDSAFTICYSPDNPASFVFCAYHGSADFSDIGHVLYSVEPSQNVRGCQVEPGTPNGQLVDSTNDVLSHETFETITDPDGTAWFIDFNQSLFQEEIGDECSFLAFNASGMFTGFDPSNVTLNGNMYAIQPEYNNFDHACTIRP